MAITSGFFDSIDGDRKYNAEQMSNYFDGLISNGIYENIGDRFVVTARTDGFLGVNVGTGRAIINCHWIKNDATVSLTLDPSDIQYPRIDAIVLRLDKRESGRNINIVVKTGVPSLSPSVPSLTRNDNVYELMLAAVTVGKNAGTIVQSNISDRRSSSLCGWVTGVIKQVDTSDLFLQWQSAYESYYEQATSDFDDYMEVKKREFEAWFTSLTKTLNVDMQLTKYQRTVYTNGITQIVSVGIPEYDSENDILFAFIGGVLLVEDDEYTITGTGENAWIVLNQEIIGENTVTFIVLKNVIGKSVMTAGEVTAQILTGTATGTKAGKSEKIDEVII